MAFLLLYRLLQSLLGVGWAGERARMSELKAAAAVGKEPGRAWCSPARESTRHANVCPRPTTQGPLWPPDIVLRSCRQWLEAAAVRPVSTHSPSPLTPHPHRATWLLSLAGGRTKQGGLRLEERRRGADPPTARSPPPAADKPHPVPSHPDPQAPKMASKPEPKRWRGDRTGLTYEDITALPQLSPRGTSPPPASVDAASPPRSPRAPSPLSPRAFMASLSSSFRSSKVAVKAEPPTIKQEDTDAEATPPKPKTNPTAAQQRCVSPYGIIPAETEEEEEQGDATQPMDVVVKKKEEEEEAGPELGALGGSMSYHPLEEDPEWGLFFPFDSLEFSCIGGHISVCRPIPDEVGGWVGWVNGHARMNLSSFHPFSPIYAVLPHLPRDAGDAVAHHPKGGQAPQDLSGDQDCRGGAGGQAFDATQGEPVRVPRGGLASGRPDAPVRILAVLLFSSLSLLILLYLPLLQARLGGQAPPVQLLVPPGTSVVLIHSLTHFPKPHPNLNPPLLPSP